MHGKTKPFTESLNSTDISPSIGKTILVVNSLQQCKCRRNSEQKYYPVIYNPQTAKSSDTVPTDRGNAYPEKSHSICHRCILQLDRFPGYDPREKFTILAWISLQTDADHRQ